MARSRRLEGSLDAVARTEKETCRLTTKQGKTFDFTPVAKCGNTNLISSLIIMLCMSGTVAIICVPDLFVFIPITKKLHAGRLPMLSGGVPSALMNRPPHQPGNYITYYYVVIMQGLVIWLLRR